MLLEYCDFYGCFAEVAFTEVEDRRLVLWENMNADEYRRRTLFEQTQNTDSRVEDTNEKYG